MKLCGTSVLVDIDRGGIDSKVRRLDDEGRHALSVVTVTELRLGVEFRHQPGTESYRQAMNDLDRLLDRFEIVPLSWSVSTAAASIIGTLRRHGRSIDALHDVHIGATAVTQDLPVLTGNTGHFQRILDLAVVDSATF